MKKIKVTILAVFLIFGICSVQTANAQILGLGSALISKAKSKSKSKKGKKALALKDTKMYISNQAFEGSDLKTAASFSAKDEIFVHIAFPVKDNLSDVHIELFAEIEKTGEKLSIGVDRIKEINPDGNYYEMNLRKASTSNIRRLQLFYEQLEIGDNPVKISIVLSDWYWGSVQIAETNTNFIKKEGEKVAVGLSFADLETGMVDPELEAEAVMLMNSVVKEEGSKKEFKKVKLLSKDWSIYYHSVSGAILGRYVIFWAYAVQPEGYCTVDAYRGYQQYNGTGFSETLLYSNHEEGTHQQVECE